MNQCASDGIQQAEHTQGDGYEIDYHRERDVELNAEHNGISQSFQIRQTAEVIAHQGYVGSLDGNIATHAAHRHTNGGSLQGGSIVDSVVRRI